MLAEAQAALGEVILALASAQRAVMLGPGVAEHRLALARVLWKAGQTDAARRESGVALSLAGSQPERLRAQEFIRFLNQIDRETPAALQIHLIADNYATHKHENVKRWFSKHKRFHIHFIPTSSSWLNLVERWFGEITRKRIRRGTFESVQQLIEAIDEYVAVHNENPKPFVWTASVQKILEKIAKVKKR